MTKLFALTMISVSLAMSAQYYTHVSNPVKEVVIFKCTDALSLANALTAH